MTYAPTLTQQQLAQINGMGGGNFVQNGAAYSPLGAYYDSSDTTFSSPLTADNDLSNAVWHNNGYSATELGHGSDVGDVVGYYDPSGTYTHSDTIKKDDWLTPLLIAAAAASGMYFGLPAMAGAASEGAGAAGISGAGFGDAGMMYAGGDAAAAGSLGGGATLGTEGALSAAFNPAMDSQIANTLIEQGAPGFEQFGGDALSGYTQAGIPSVTVNGPAVDASSFTNTDSVFNPAQDSQLANEAIEARAPGFEQFDGDALSGYTSGGLPSVTVNGAPTGNVAHDWMSSLTKGISPADAVKIITAAVGATGGATGNSGGNTSTGGETKDTAPFDYGPARYLPPGWRQDRPMYVPGLEAVPDGWYGAGYSQG